MPRAFQNVRHLLLRGGLETAVELCRISSKECVGLMTVTVLAEDDDVLRQEGSLWVLGWLKNVVTMEVLKSERFATQVAERSMFMPYPLRQSLPSSVPRCASSSA